MTLYLDFSATERVEIKHLISTLVLPLAKSGERKFLNALVATLVANNVVPSDWQRLCRIAPAFADFPLVERYATVDDANGWMLRELDAHASQARQRAANATHDVPPWEEIFEAPTLQYSDDEFVAICQALRQRDTPLSVEERALLTARHAFLSEEIKQKLLTKMV